LIALENTYSHPQNGHGQQSYCNPQKAPHCAETRHNLAQECVCSAAVTEVGALSVAGWACWAWSTHASVSASQQQTLSGRGARVYTCTCVHDNIPRERLSK